MHSRTLAAVSGLIASCLAFPDTQARDIEPTTLVYDSNMPRQNVAADTAHANALLHHPAEHIVNSSSLFDYLSIHAGSPYTIYVSDTRSFIDLSTVVLPPINTSAGNLHDRDLPPYCIPHTNTYTKQTGQWYTNWRPASYNPVCFETGNSDDPGAVSLSWSFSLSIIENAGLSWDIIKNVLSANLGLSVQESYTSSSTATCNVGADSVVQVWAQPYIAWGWFWSQECFTCVHTSQPCNAEYVNGGATAPVSGRFNLGCSTGWDKVQGC